MRAGGALFVWTNIPAAVEADFNDWYDRDHLIERVEIEGFLRARRFEALAAPRKYLAMYEVDDLAVFRGETYNRSVNNPRPSTRNIVKHFYDTGRVLGQVRRRAGCDGSIVAALRIEVPAAGRAALDQAMGAIDLVPLIAERGMLGATLAEEEAALSASDNAGKQLRKAAGKDARGDWIAVLEGTDRDVVEKNARALASGLPAGADVEVGLYRYRCCRNANQV